jgi:hypothetical protein
MHDIPLVQTASIHLSSSALLLLSRQFGPITHLLHIPHHLQLLYEVHGSPILAQNTSYLDD